MIYLLESERLNRPTYMFVFKNGLSSIMFYWNSLFTFQSIEIGKQIEITINGENLEIQSWIKNYYNDIENQYNNVLIDKFEPS